MDSEQDRSQLAEALFIEFFVSSKVHIEAKVFLPDHPVGTVDMVFEVEDAPTEQLEAYIEGLVDYLDIGAELKDWRVL